MGRAPGARAGRTTGAPRARCEGEGLTPEAPSSAEAPPRRPLALAAGFTLGFAIAAVVAAVALRPDIPRALIERARWGTSSSGGILLLASQDSAGAPVRVVFRNISDAPVQLMIGEGGDELAFELRDEAGRSVDPPPPSPPPTNAELGVGIEPRVLAAGQEVAIEVPLSRVVTSPGRYRLVVERAALLPDKLRLRSNEVAIEAR